MCEAERTLMGHLLDIRHGFLSPEPRRGGGGAATLGLDFLETWRRWGPQDPGESGSHGALPQHPGSLSPAWETPLPPPGSHPSVAPRAPTTEANGSSALLLKTGNAEVLRVSLGRSSPAGLGQFLSLTSQP